MLVIKSARTRLDRPATFDYIVIVGKVGTKVLDRVHSVSLPRAEAEIHSPRRPLRLGARLIDALALRRVQLVGAILFGVLLPALLVWPTLGISGVSTNPESLVNSGVSTLVCSIFAVLAGYVVYRQLGSHPGVEAISYTLWAFTLSFAVLAIALLMARIEYARYQLGLTYLATIAWFLLVQVLIRNRCTMRLAVAPATGIAALPQSRSVQWLPMDEPVLPPGASGVVADLRANHPAEWERFLTRCALAGLPVFDVRHVTESITGRVDIQHLSENTLSSTLHAVVYARLKRALDWAVVAFVAPGFAVLIAAAAIAIRLDSPGPIFFRQQRMGHRGRPFVIWKLRTMRNDIAGARFTEENDPRITKVGRFLRKYRFDELPQIWNVMKGDMSWIGPRPEAVELAEWYEREVPFYAYRHMMRPGLTGWAQVNQGNVAEISAAHEKLKYDFYYIKHFSPWLDLLISLKTVRILLTGFGSL